MRQKFAAKFEFENGRKIEDRDFNPKLLVDCESFVMTKLKTSPYNFAKQQKTETPNEVSTVISRRNIGDVTVFLARIAGLKNPESYQTHSCTIFSYDLKFVVDRSHHTK